MFLRGWRLLTLLLTALSAGMAYCHLLELSAKMKYSGSLYLMLHRTLYHEFGTVGGALEVAAAFATVVLTVLVRHRRGAFLLTLAAAVCLAAALAVFLAFVAPANSAMFRMPLQRPPVEWVRWRDQWEYSHAVRTALTVLGFALLLWSSLRETPTTLKQRDRAAAP